MEARQPASREDGCAAARMIYCACCGSGMYSAYSVNKERRYRYYVCYRSQQKLEDYCTSRAVAAPSVEEAVVQSIRRVGVQPDVLAETARVARQQLAEIGRPHFFRKSLSFPFIVSRRRRTTAFTPVDLREIGGRDLCWSALIH